MADIPNITLVSLGNFEKRTLRILVEMVNKEIKAHIRLHEEHRELLPYFDSTRRQYNADQLLALVDELAIDHNHKTIGLFSVDLYIPILTYIFGQAKLNGASGVASSYRLHNERYGLPHDHKLMIERFSKEIIHELGHTFGLIHCHNALCVMQSSTYVEDIDQKEAAFCVHCKAQLDSIMT